MIVLALKSGRLSNRLFLSAHFIAFARDYGQQVVNVAFDEYARFFTGTCSDLLCRYPTRTSVLSPNRATRRAVYLLAKRGESVLVRSDRRQCTAAIVRTGWPQTATLADTYDLSSDEFVEVATSRRLVLVKGWQFQHNEGVARHAAAIREVFTPTETHRETIENKVTEARGSAELLVGVHVRRTDYRRLWGGRYFFEDEVYLDAMTKVRELFSDREVRFLVCSDEAQSRARFAPHAVTLGTGHLVEDLYALSSCDLLIGPPSTFSLWASFYSETPLYMLRRARSPIATSDFRVYRSQFGFDL